MSAILNHRHIVVSASGLRNAPHLASTIEDWLRRLVGAVGMNILIDPQAVFCATPGNEGVTGIVCLETSHSSIHVWSENSDPFLRMDLYSCQHFDADVVMRMIQEFEPQAATWMVIDRNDHAEHVIVESGVYPSKAL